MYEIVKGKIYITYSDSTNISPTSLFPSSKLAPTVLSFWFCDPLNLTRDTLTGTGIEPSTRVKTFEYMLCTSSLRMFGESGIPDSYLMF